jgi:small subunit ribosomal protein S9
MRYYYAVWRRKLASATVKLYPQWNGVHVVKKWDQIIDLKDYFAWNIYLYETAIAPFLYLGWETLNKYNLEISVKGWWVMGQADAMRLAFSRALILLDEQLRPTLKPLGMLVRDPRIKERKKPGLKKARKSPQWSKR